jgi:hypothetical protein
MDENDDFTVFSNAVAEALYQAKLIKERMAKIEQESTAKDELIERLKEENASLMRENIHMRQNPNHWRF